MKLDAAELPFVLNVDGRRTIREIVACAAQNGVSPESRAAHLEKFAGKLFQSLWRLDFVAMAVNRNPNP